MKFLRKKALLTTFIALFASFCAHITQAENLPWYYFQQPGIIYYRNNCECISIGQKIRYASSTLYYYLTHKKTELEQPLADIETELKNFEKTLLDAEQTILLGIKQKYAISDTHWQHCLADIKKINSSYSTAMRNPHPGVTHDQNLPEDIKEMLIMHLKQNNINPNSVNLKLATEDEVKNRLDDLAEALYAVYLYNCSQNNSLVCPEYIPAQITIFPAVLAKTTEAKMSICAHEVQHLISKHTITQLIVQTYIKRYYSIEADIFKKTEEYRKLVQIHEAQAEVLAALNNPPAARCLKNFRQRSYYPNTLHEEHFYDLARIDRLWKLHDKLEALYFA
jgi:hypothetical protein